MPNLLRSIDVAAGTVVSVPFPGGRHLGLLTHTIVAGDRTVISNSRALGGVAEQTFAEFAAGLEVSTDESIRGALQCWEIEARARAQIGNGVPWSVAWNCEHFVRHAHGLPIASPQVRNATIAVAVIVTLGLFAWAVSRSA